ncbi:predicted protein [Uncinocarpus reesii 1704]|uniref:Uncharacterized protein n=1 Tax=Uncinocarpus reesii (strain UAMH 1704) TaxID=336963 RepID=C4JZ07_UNCRE|nr:uncharacterized protein UREG_07408 [Uncinocarpus reesii 1704]EEP82543.1 predicted protein [Uncinocarpus reesii 1704]
MAVLEPIKKSLKLAKGFLEGGLVWRTGVSTILFLQQRFKGKTRWLRLQEPSSILLKPAQPSLLQALTCTGTRGPPRIQVLRTLSSELHRLREPGSCRVVRSPAPHDVIDRGRSTGGSRAKPICAVCSGGSTALVIYLSRGLFWLFCGCRCMTRRLFANSGLLDIQGRTASSAGSSHKKKKKKRRRYADATSVAGCLSCSR